MTETLARDTRTVASIVGGRPETDAPGGRLVSTNPADSSDVVAEALLGDASTFVAACRAARAAQQGWAEVPAPVRGRAIQQIGRLVEDNKEALARLVTREIGKPYAESLGEVQEIVDTCNFFVSEGRRLYGQTVPSEMSDKQLFTFRNPVGVAAIITAGNFPVAVPSWYLVPALLCGNSVVWKPAEYAPALGEALAELFLHGGLPEGVLNLVQCDGPTAFEGLEQALEAGLVDKVGFTGSSGVGSRLGELCGRHLQSPCLELGGKNPLVVMPDAQLELAVEGALFSGFGTAGQRCTSLGTVIVHESVHDEFMAQFARAVEEAPVGDPTQDVVYGPMINERFLERFLGWLGLIRDHHTVHGSTATGRIGSDNPRSGFVGDPDVGLYCHPDDRGRRAPRRRALLDGDLRPDRGRDDVLGLRRGGGARERSRIRTLGRDLHHRREERVRVPPPRQRRHGEREQLHLRRGGAPALRRQRQVGQRRAPVRHLGARPVHPLAGAQLGLRRQAPEGADGRGRRIRRPRLPPSR